MVRVGPFQAAALFLYFIITFSQLHFTTSVPPGMTFKLIPRDFPDSPLYPGNLTQVERVKRMIRFSEARAAYLESVSTPSAALAPDRIIFPLLRDVFFYIVQVGMGTPPVQVFLLMDTGGGLIWTQCEPCKNCYRQRMPLFSSLASSTYRKLPCDHPLCQGDNNLFRCVDQLCIYNVNYGSGSAITKGVASLESFRFATDTSATIIGGIIFGCSNDSQNAEFEKRGVISGIMGLSFSPLSIVSQLSYEIDKRFSYCLVPFTDALMAPSYVKFGNDIPVPSGNIQKTKFVTHSGSFYYHLNLIDISVGFRRLGFAPDLFKIRQDGTGGCFIDSGALIPQIDQNTVGRNAYRAVMGAFQNYYDAFRLQRMGNVPEGFQLCYKNSPGFNNFTTLAYHFEEALYVVDGKYVNYYNIDLGYFCVALKPGNGRTVLGAWHQQDKRIIYNGNINALQFEAEHCAMDVPP